MRASMNMLKLSGSVAAITLGLAAGNAQAITLPPPQCSPVPAGTQTCIQFQDFTVYSLAFLNFQAGAGDVNGNDPFAVSSNGSAIANSVVVASQPTNATNNQDLAIAGRLDDAYNTPNNVASGAANFLMVPPDPAPTFAGDNVRQPSTLVLDPLAPNVPGAVTPVGPGTLPLWDIQVSALNTFLGPNTSPVFLFNLNEENAGGLDSGQDMYGWLRVYLTDTDTGNFVQFTLGGGSVAGCIAANPTCALQTPLVDDILPTALDTWAFVHGQICVADGSVGGHPASELLGFGACTQAQKAFGGQTVNQNLGANLAAFALVSSGLNAALATGIYEVMSVDLRMAHIGNGFEQLFIVGANAIPQDVPEPATLTVFGTGLALIGLGRLRRRRRTRKA